MVTSTGSPVLGSPELECPNSWTSLAAPISPVVSVVNYHLSFCSPVLFHVHYTQLYIHVPCHVTRLWWHSIACHVLCGHAGYLKATKAFLPLCLCRSCLPSMGNPIIIHAQTCHRLEELTSVDGVWLRTYSVHMKTTHNVIIYELHWSQT